MVLKFTDNALICSGDEQDDLAVYEAGNSAQEIIEVFISIDGNDWIKVGNGNRKCLFDIDSVTGVNCGEKYSYVKIVDYSGLNIGSSYEGADMDAVGAITSTSPLISEEQNNEPPVSQTEVPEFPTIAIPMLAIMGLALIYGRKNSKNNSTSYCFLSSFLFYFVDTTPCNFFHSCLNHMDIYRNLMLETIALLLVSLIMITKGADWFVESAVAISEKSGIPKIIIGATIVSFATTAPEFTVSAMAAYLNHVEMTVGNAVGSAICNIGLVLGAVIAIKAIPIELHGFTRKGGFMLGSALLLLAVSYDGVVSSFDGILLLLVFLGFMYYNFRLQRAVFDGNEEIREKVPVSQLKKEILLFITGALLVVIGSRILVDVGITIAEWLGIPEMIIALTLVALGTSCRTDNCSFSHPKRTSGHIHRKHTWCKYHGYCTYTWGILTDKTSDNIATVTEL